MAMIVVGIWVRVALPGKQKDEEGRLERIGGVNPVTGRVNCSIWYPGSGTKTLSNVKLLKVKDDLDDVELLKSLK